MTDLIALYCSVDDFWKTFQPDWKKHQLGSKKPRGPKEKFSTPEMMTIIIMFQQSNYRNFKYFYYHIKQFYLEYFPSLISDSRFVERMKSLLTPLFAYLLSRRGDMTGISFIDATSIRVCHNKRISRNKVFKGFAKRGKTTSGWFFGFKLHLIINDKGEILSFLITPGNISDISVVEDLSKGIFVKLFGDTGYISSKVFRKLFERGLNLVTTIRSNMKERLIPLKDKILLRKRSIIETVNDQLKNIAQIEHTRHRSLSNFLVNMLGALAAYSHQEKKPSINLEECKSNLPLAI